MAKPTRPAYRPACLLGPAALNAVLLFCCAASAGDLVLSEFNGTGVSYPFGSFSSTTGPDSLRVFGANDSGGVGVSTSLDLTSYADSRFVVDLTTNAGNTSESFDLELLDTFGNAGKWRIGVSEFIDGSPAQIVSATTLANPTSGANFGILDLANISAWQIVGRYSSPAPFDIDFDRVIISDTVAPPPPYPGAEPDAPWRGEAASRIAAHRMADLEVLVTDARGVPLPGATVEFRMTDHEFRFGSAVRAANLVDGGADNDIYRQKVEELFDIAVVENNLKWEPWVGEWGPNWSQARARQGVDWLNDRGIAVRGHNLVWPGYDNVPFSAKSRLQDFVDSGTPLTAAQKSQLKLLIELHLQDIGGEFAGDIDAWDVVNEPRSNNDVMAALDEGDLIMVDWFNQARSLDADAKLYLNDFDILTGGGTDTFNQQDYYDRAQFLIDNGAALDGVGFQSHFTEGQLTGSEQVWEILDRFDELGLDMQVTEFDFETTNEQLQADYTRDFMTAAFAHEGIDDFLVWGFWEGEHWRPDAAMFRQDWSVKPNGEAFLELVFNEWWTEEDLLAGVDGIAATRGFKGEYEILVEYGGVQRLVPVTLTDGGLSLTLELGLLAGDFNQDGVVDGADYSVWRDGRGDPYTQADYDLWLGNYGASLTSLTTTSVPEPTTYLLLGGLLLVDAARRKP